MKKKMVIVKVKHGTIEDAQKLTRELERIQAFGSLVGYEFIVVAGDVQFSTLEEKIIEKLKKRGKMKVECWCYITERNCRLDGEIVGKRQAELLRVDNCQHRDCPKRFSVDCLIGKVLEGRWP